MATFRSVFKYLKQTKIIRDPEDDAIDTHTSSGHDRSISPGISDRDVRGRRRQRMVPSFVARSPDSSCATDTHTGSGHDRSISPGISDRDVRGRRRQRMVPFFVARSPDSSCATDTHTGSGHERSISPGISNQDEVFGQSPSPSRSSSPCSSESSWKPGSTDGSSESSEYEVGRKRETSLGATAAPSPFRFPKDPEMCRDNNYVSDSDSDTQTAPFPALVKKTLVKGKSKQHCCMFCSKLNTKMSTHLQRIHKNEPEVAKILALNKGDPVRRQEFIRLQNEGDFQHNFRVLSGEDGRLIAKYNKKAGLKAASEYSACPFCKALFQQNLVSKHVHRCRHKPENCAEMKKGQCSRMGKLILPLPKGISLAFYEKVISRMKDDNITRIVKADDLIVKYGQRLFSRQDIEEHSSSNVSGRLRELGRLCIILRKSTDMKISRLSQALDPENFEAVLDAVRELGGFIQETNLCTKGSLVHKIGYSIKKCCQILKADGIKNDNVELVRKCERFESLYDGDWYDHISACASQSVRRARMNRLKLLPSLADVQKVNELVDQRLGADSYAVLAKSVLAAITIFNRKRGGEVQRMKCDDYLQGRKSSQPEQKILDNLTATEKKLVSVLQRVEIRGKFNRAVPVLLTPAMTSGIDKLLVLRRLMGITSPYLFVSQTGERPYRGSAVLKELADEAHVDPTLFTATSLRKQLATLSQALEISKYNQDNLATFLGHDIRIHRNIYCQPVDIVQKAKVASILMKVNAGVQIDSSCVENVEREEVDQQSDEGSDTDSCSEHDMPIDDLPISSSEHDRAKTISPSQTMTLSLPTSGSDTKESSSQKCTKTKSRKTAVKRPWTADEAAAVRRNLANCIIMKQVPQKDACERALAAEPVLHKRSWKDIKYFVYNQLKKSK